MTPAVKTIFALLLAGFLGTCGRAPEDSAEDLLFVERTDTGVESINQLTPTEDFNIVEYLYYYNGGGVAATDINGDGLPDLYFTNNQGPNTYYINEGNWRFRDATAEAGVAGAGEWSTGVSVVDVNADGLPDIYVCNLSGYKGLKGENELFIQSADGTFTEAAAEYGLAYGGFNTQAYWFDYDRDGDEDVYLLRHSVHSDATYRDGTERERPDSLAGDLLLRNDGGHFVDVTAEQGLYSSKIGYGLSAAIADYDGDGFPDIYVCNDFSENDYLYLNQGGTGFREVIRERTGHTSNFSMGSDVGDVDGDGRPDLLTLDMRPGDEQVLKSTASAEAYNLYRLKRRAGYHDQLPRNALQWNRGGGQFSEIAEMAGLAATDWSWSVLVEDFDLDGAAEVFVANGIEQRPNDLDYLKFISSSVARQSGNLAVAAEMPSGYVANQFFDRDSGLVFHPKTAGVEFTGSSTGAAAADLDGDGDLDLVLNNVNASAKLYQNRALDGATIEGANADSSRLTYGWPDGRRAELRTAGDHTFMMARQRGFLSQSTPPVLVATPAGDTQPATGDTVVYRLLAWGTGEAEAKPTGPRSFDREPLQPFPGAVPDSEPAYPLVAEAGDLRVEAGMWLPIRIGRRVGERWDYEALPGTRGWWQSVSVSGPAGAEEIVVGNWGLNSALGRPTAEAPVRLYLQDLDGNGRRDPLLTYVRGGREYSLADKDELAGQFPSWRRNNLSYADFSQRDFRENFPGVTVEPLVAETLAHLRLFRGATGAWEYEALPAGTQITPIRASRLTEVGWLLGGNRLDVLPRIGRQDAAALQLLRRDGGVQFIDLGPDHNHREVVAVQTEGEGRYRIEFADGGWVILGLP